MLSARCAVNWGVQIAGMNFQTHSRMFLTEYEEEKKNVQDYNRR